MSQKHTVVITGASSGVGLQAARSLAQSGDWHVVMACRNLDKAKTEGDRVGVPADSRSLIHLDLSSLNSVRQFVKEFRDTGLTLDALV
ncbi:MAG: SDR family NAD(P)-dependent oxidoreductase, partial [Cyanobacteria bacterium J06648_11]